MVLDIKPLYDDSMECLENEIASVISWWGRGFELGFAKTWDFTFKPSNTGSYERFADRLRMSYGSIFEQIEHYHGIRVSMNDTKTADEIFPIIRKELSEGRPVIIYMKAFWCPWHVTFYQKLHDGNSHFCLVIGIDEVNNFLYCIDPILTSIIQCMPFENFIKGCGNCVTFAETGEEKSALDYQDIIAQAVSLLTDKSRAKSAFDDIRYMADEFESSFNVPLEIKGYEEALDLVPLVWQLEMVGRRRKKFAKSLQYLAAHCKKPELMPFSERMVKAGDRWSMIKLMFGKACRSSKPESQLKQIAQTIRLAADDEEDIASSLLSVK